MRNPREVFRFISDRPIVQVFLAAAAVAVATGVHSARNPMLANESRPETPTKFQTRLVLEPKEQVFQNFLDRLEAARKLDGFSFQYVRNVNALGLIEKDEARTPYFLSLQTNTLEASSGFRVEQDELSWDNEVTLIRGNRVEVYAVRTLSFFPDSPSYDINLLHLRKVVTFVGPTGTPQEETYIQKIS